MQESGRYSVYNIKWRRFLHHDCFYPSFALTVLTAAKKGRIISDGEESDSDVAPEKPKKPIGSDSEEDDDKADDAKKKEEKDLFGSDSESGNEQE